MVRLFVTGDNHLGKKYDRYPEVKEKLIQSRFDVLQNMVQKAEAEGCDLFVVTGDLFDSVSTVKVSDVKKAADILASFTGSVIVLPGNHDYYTGEEKVWKDFEHALFSRDHNITLIKEFRPYFFDAGEEKIAVYPAFCQSRHSRENNLGWIREAQIQAEGIINIGLAHGAIKGVTPDMEGIYFLMTEEELSHIPVDVWLIGHTHIPYPDHLSEDADTPGYKIFNAGTHEQTDLHNHTDGNGFILSIEKQGSAASVCARKYVSGKVHYYDLDIPVKPDSDTALADAVKAAVNGKDRNAVVRIRVSGSVRQAEYQEKDRIYRELLGSFLTYETEDRELSEEITVDRIREEFAQTSFAAQLLEAFIDQPKELQMVYELIQRCRENERRSSG